MRRVAAAASLVALALLIGARPASAARPVARPELAHGLRELADRLDRDLAPRDAPASADAPSAALDARELRRRLATAQRDLAGLGGSDRWLDPFFERQDEAKDDAQRAELARAAAASLRLIGDEVESALAARDTAGARARHDAQARAALSRVLAEDEFRRFPRDVAAPGDLARWFARLLDWWRHWHPPGIPAALRFFADWTSVILFASVMALVAWLAYGLFARARRARALSAEVRPGAERRPPAVTDLEAWVRDGAAAGAFREALRASHLVTLGRLRATGALPTGLGLTHWDYLSGLRGARVPARALDHFAELNREFDDAWYGHAAIDHDRFERFRATTQTFLEEMRRFVPGTSIPAP